MSNLEKLNNLEKSNDSFGKTLYRYDGDWMYKEDVLRCMDNEYLYNPENIKRCVGCPENIGCTGINQLPCGQYHCWVALHCKNKKKTTN